MITELVIATRNRKKIEEIRRILQGLSVTLFTLDDHPECHEVEEDATTFEDNAAKKARAVANYSKKPSIADDSGLEVDARGAPGVFSAQYAGEGADDRKYNKNWVSACLSTGY